MTVTRWLPGRHLALAAGGARRGVRRALDAATGTVLLGFGLRLAAEQA